MPTRAGVIRIGLAILFGVVAVAVTATAGMPHAIAIPDGVTREIMLFDVRTGEYVGCLALGEVGEVDSPLDCARGPTLSIEDDEYPDTVLVSDLTLGSVFAIDPDDGTVLKTFLAGVGARGLACDPDGKLLVAAGTAGVLAYQADGTPAGVRIAPKPVDGPRKAWDVLVRREVAGGDGDLLVADPSLDRILRFDLNGTRLGIFAELPSFRFVEQLALCASGNVLAVDTLGGAVHEFAEDGTWLREITVTRPRGVIELLSGDLLVASEDGVQVFDGETGDLLATPMAGYPVSAPRYVTLLYRPGDMTGDGIINNFDIGPFVLALTNLERFAELYPSVHGPFAGDVNGDGVFNNFDIAAFVDALLGG
ncbi:MAG: hypothetical protein PVJ57_11800 [Phycisphaerae bacterium]|jgi:hypothetical protein